MSLSYSYIVVLSTFSYSKKIKFFSYMFYFGRPMIVRYEILIN